MKNLIKISLIICLLAFSKTASAKGWKSDTIKVVKQDGEIAMIVLNNIKDVDEVKSFKFNKIISNLEANDQTQGELLISGNNTNYRLKKSEGLYFLSELSNKAKDMYAIRIYKTTSESELENIKNQAAEKGIDIVYENLQIVNGEIEAITLKVDCNDGYSGTASSTNIPESGIGFKRDYSENSSSPFQMGKVFGEKERKLEAMEDDFDTAFNDEKVIKKEKNKSSWIKHDHDVEFSMGLNNYVNEDNKFPESDNKPFALDPLTSWTYGLHSVHRISVSPYVKFNFQLGVQWNNFALADNNYQIIKGPEQVELLNTELTRPDINSTRSKLNVTYLNFNLVPMFHLGKSSSAFRFGAGPYASYRIASKSKFKYDDDGKDIINNNFHLNPWKYGVKAQIGWKGVDLFATYDISPVFAENRGFEAGYDLRAISFGIIF